jgi:flavin reductase (DIM6/NTAB) family NADH-FMN oxidoreductase RutF
MRRTFDALMRAFDTSLVVVTSSDGRERAGCLVGFHSQCSIDPVRYAVWLSKANHTYRVAMLAEHLCVHVLTEHDRALAELFGETSGDDVDKFERCNWTEGPYGLPVLDACDAWFIGHREALFDAGTDHVCFVLRPVDAHNDVEGDGDGLRPLRLHAVADFTPGHGAEERPVPPTTRA